MGLFSSIFGGGKKTNWGEMIPDPPSYSLAPGSLGQYTGGLQDLIDVFQRRSQGTDPFDVISYIYGPQATELRQNYGIDTNPGDIYSSRTGALPQTLASLNSRGLLDTGTSGIIEGQLRSNLANELARAYGGAKTTQRQDIDNSLQALSQLFPQRFEAQNIQSQVDYDNSMNRYNALLNRNMATVGDQQQRQAQRGDMFQGLLGTGLNFLTGGFGGGGGFNIGNALGNVTGTYNPYDSYLKNLFQPNSYGTSSYGTSIPGNSGSRFLRRNVNSYYPFQNGAF